jgi:hypothetical protein
VLSEGIYSISANYLVNIIFPCDILIVTLKRSEVKGSDEKKISLLPTNFEV